MEKAPWITGCLAFLPRPPLSAKQDDRSDRRLADTQAAHRLTPYSLLWSLNDCPKSVLNGRRVTAQQLSENRAWRKMGGGALAC